MSDSPSSSDSTIGGAARIQISLRKGMGTTGSGNSIESAIAANPGLYKSVRKALKQQTLNFKINVECTSLKVSPSGNFLWGGFSDGTLRVWDLSGTFGVQDDDVVASRQKTGLLVNSKLTQGYGAVASQIHARGVHTDLITTVDISDDAQYVFMGVSRGAMELHAVFVGDLERAVHTQKYKERLLQGMDVPPVKRNILDYLKVYCHSDAKLKGFGACSTLQIRSDSPRSSLSPATPYLLLTGKGIKNIHIWKFIPPTHPDNSCIGKVGDDGNDQSLFRRNRQQSICDPPEDEEDNGVWEQLYDTSTNGNTIVLLGFYRNPQQKLLAVSKSDAQKLRLWDLSFEETAEASVASTCESDEDSDSSSGQSRPKRPPYQDVENSQQALDIAGGIGVCGGGNMYNEMSIVSLDRPKDPYNHTELALPSGSSSGSQDSSATGAYASRRQRRGEMKAVVNVATSQRDSSHALLELDDGSLVGYSAGSSSSGDSIPKLAMATPESTGIPALPAEFWRRCICLANISGVVIAASSLYNPNTNKGQLVIRALGGLKKPRGSKVAEQKKKKKQEQLRKLLQQQQHEQEEREKELEQQKEKKRQEYLEHKRKMEQQKEKEQLKLLERQQQERERQEQLEQKRQLEQQAQKERLKLLKFQQQEKERQEQLEQKRQLEQQAQKERLKLLKFQQQEKERQEQLEQKRQLEQQAQKERLKLLKLQQQEKERQEQLEQKRQLEQQAQKERLKLWKLQQQEKERQEQLEQKRRLEQQAQKERLKLLKLQQQEKERQEQLEQKRKMEQQKEKERLKQLERERKLEQQKEKERLKLLNLQQQEKERLKQLNLQQQEKERLNLLKLKQQEKERLKQLERERKLEQQKEKGRLNLLKLKQQEKERQKQLEQQKESARLKLQQQEKLRREQAERKKEYLKLLNLQQREKEREEENFQRLKLQQEEKERQDQLKHLKLQEKGQARGQLGDLQQQQLQDRQLVAIPKTPSPIHTGSLDDSRVVADKDALNDAVSAHILSTYQTNTGKKSKQSAMSNPNQVSPQNTRLESTSRLSHVSPSAGLETPMHSNRTSTSDQEESPDSTRKMQKISHFLQPKRINLQPDPETKPQEATKKRKAEPNTKSKAAEKDALVLTDSATPSTNNSRVCLFQLREADNIPFSSPKPKSKKRKKASTTNAPIEPKRPIDVEAASESVVPTTKILFDISSSTVSNASDQKRSRTGLENGPKAKAISKIACTDGDLSAAILLTKLAGRQESPAIHGTKDPEITASKVIATVSDTKSVVVVTSGVPADKEKTMPKTTSKSKRTVSVPNTHQQQQPLKQTVPETPPVKPKSVSKLRTTAVIQPQQASHSFSREVVLNEKINEQYKQLRALLKNFTDQSMKLIHSRNLRGPVPSALDNRNHLDAYSKLLEEHRAAHNHLQRGLLKSAETTLWLLKESRISSDEARIELKQSIKKFGKFLYDTLHRQEMERLALVSKHPNTANKFKKNRKQTPSPSCTTAKQSNYPCKAAFEKVEDICAAITRPVGRPRSGLAPLRG